MLGSNKQDKLDAKRESDADHTAFEGRVITFFQEMCDDILIYRRGMGSNDDTKKIEFSIDKQKSFNRLLLSSPKATINVKWFINTQCYWIRGEGKIFGLVYIDKTEIQITSIYGYSTGEGSGYKDYGGKIMTYTREDFEGDWMQRFGKGTIQPVLIDYFRCFPK